MTSRVTWLWTRWRRTAEIGLCRLPTDEDQHNYDDTLILIFTGASFDRIMHIIMCFISVKIHIIRPHSGNSVCLKYLANSYFRTNYTQKTRYAAVAEKTRDAPYYLEILLTHKKPQEVARLSLYKYRPTQWVFYTVHFLLNFLLPTLTFTDLHWPRINTESHQYQGSHGSLNVLESPWI